MGSRPRKDTPVKKLARGALCARANDGASVIRFNQHFSGAGRVLDQIGGVLWQLRDPSGRAARQGASGGHTDRREDPN